MERLIDRSSYVLLWASGIVIALATVMLCYNAIGRTLFSSSFQPNVELARNAVALIVYMQVPNAIWRGGLLRVRLVYNNVAAPLRFAMDAFGYFAGIALFGVIAWFTWEPMLTSFAIGEEEGSENFYMPLGPTRLLAIVLWTFAAVVCATMVWRALRGRSATDGDDELSI